MEQSVIGRNEVILNGTVVSDAIFSHKLDDEKFYIFHLSVNRISKLVDEIPIMISKNNPLFSEINIGNRIRVEGYYRSYSRHIGNKTNLILTVYAEKILFLSESQKDKNNIILEGYICKDVIFRITPKGIKIADLMLAVNRTYSKANYIPCIAWNGNAITISELNVGRRISIIGRIQSREYKKTFPDGTQETRVAYEVSINDFEEE